MQKYKTNVKILKDLCEDYLSYLDKYGNECAYTDRKLEDILGYAEEIKEKYQKDGGII